MNEIDQYREYARECVESAKHAVSPEEEKTFLEMADAWMRAIYQLQRRSTEGRPDRSASVSQAP